MITKTEVKVEKDLANKKITFTKHFNAKPEDVWKAWTKNEILDQWWVPKPWHAITKKFEFMNGGTWLYAMVGRENNRQHAKVVFANIHAPKSYEGTDSFTDEKGNVYTVLPQSQWKNEFRSSGDGTEVKVTITSKEAGALEKMMGMGFEEGFKMSLGNLEEYFEEHHQK
jgi:uncharacterized protein YndB with AHSA1/START domain